MSIIVDGYNYIGRSRTLRLDDPAARDTIISVFGQYCSRTRKSLTIVFDGTHSVNLANRKRQYGRVTVIYTSPTSSADDLIKRLIEERAHGQRQGLLIVTSDEDIAHCAKAHKVAWIRSEAFEDTVRRALAAPPTLDRQNIRLSPQEVQQWLDIFGAAEDEPPVAAPIGRNARRAGRKTVPPLETPLPPVAEQSAAEKSEEPERVSTRRPVPHPSQARKSSQKSPDPPVAVDRVNVHLSEDAVEAWLKIFEDADNDA